MKRREFIGGLGAISAWPLTARAQQAGMPLIGFLSGRASEDSGYLVEAFNRGLAENGFADGKSVAIEYRWASGAYDRLPKFAAELVGRQVAVLVAVGGDASARAAKAATSEIPIVFGMSSDPVAAGLVASFSHPGGNVTGVSFLTNQMEAKRFGLLHELLGPVVVGVLVNPTFPRRRLHCGNLNRPSGRPDSGSSWQGRATMAGLMPHSHCSIPSALAACWWRPIRSSTPETPGLLGLRCNASCRGIYQFREYALAGGLLSYGINLAEAYHQFGVFAAEILRGAKPADLPVQQSVKFEMVINLKTAKAIGFEFPATFSARADEAIE